MAILNLVKLTMKRNHQLLEIYVYACVSVFVHMYICVFICMCVYCVYMCLYVYVHMGIVCVCISVCVKDKKSEKDFWKSAFLASLSDKHRNWIRESCTSPAPQSPAGDQAWYLPSCCPCTASCFLGEKAIPSQHSWLSLLQLHPSLPPCCCEPPSPMSRVFATLSLELQTTADP